MTQLLNEIEQALTELLQSGLDTGAPSASRQLGTLAAQCEEMGLHTGAALLLEVEEGLSTRAHMIEKKDLTLSAAICRTIRYLELCREKLQEESIIQRWQNLYEKEEEDCL